MAVKVAINGFGRIGRLFFRLAEEHPRNFEVVAINDLVPADNLAYLIKYDSVHRHPECEVYAKNNDLIYKGKPIKVFSERDPSKLPLGDLGIDYVVESTGLFTTPEDAALHLKAGARLVIITAPAKGHQIPTFVYGVNHRDYNPKKIRLYLMLLVLRIV